MGGCRIETMTSHDLTPRVKTVLQGHGAVIFHDVTRYGLHRMCVAQFNQYPDLEPWLAMIEKARVLAHRYVEKETAGVFIGYLWIYFKEGEG
jgi:hypothetical protein